MIPSGNSNHYYSALAANISMLLPHPRIHYYSALSANISMLLSHHIIRIIRLFKTDFGVDKILISETSESIMSENSSRRKPGRPPKIHPPGTINGILAECAVCQDRATGLHYSVMTCEGCKGFFKRSIQAEKTYKCRNNNNCIISKETRNSCQACRIRRCFEKGMKENLVRDDRTPGNRKKKYDETASNRSLTSSENTNYMYDLNIKQESQCIEDMKDLALDGYSVLCKKRFKSLNSDYSKEISPNEFDNLGVSSHSINNELLSGDLSSPNEMDEWELSLLSDVLVDTNPSEAVHQMVYDQSRCTTDDGYQTIVNCSSSSEVQTKACKQKPKCLMHLLTKLVKAKPAEPAFCKYFSKYPSSEEVIECLADEIHLIIKFAKKTPGFCEQDMNHKLGIIHKYSLNLLFIRMIYRSFSCHSNHIQLASNLCIGPDDIPHMEIISPRFYQAIVQLICSFKSLNIDIYELCLIQYVVIEDEEGDCELHEKPPFINALNNTKRNISQNYLKIYTSTQYPDLPQRWILIMLCLSQIDEVSKLFMLDCVELIKANRLPILNEIMRELFSSHL